MRNLIQTLIDNKDTLIEGIVYSVKEEIFQKKDDFFDDKKQAVDTIEFFYEDLEIYYEEVWRDGLAKAYHPCQAVQIPKGHGRIGDLDGVIKQIDESPTFASKYKGTARLFIDVYSDSNTILEAEGEER